MRDKCENIILHFKVIVFYKHSPVLIKTHCVVWPDPTNILNDRDDFFEDPDIIYIIYIIYIHPCIQAVFFLLAFVVILIDFSVHCHHQRLLSEMGKSVDCSLIPQSIFWAKKMSENI